MGWYPVKTPDDFHQQCHSITLFNTHKTARPSPEVVGVFHLTGSSDMNYREGLLLLCGHARALFYQRPDRLFVHGFYVFGHSMKCWMFDRSGIYSSEPVNLNKDTTHFWTIMAAYSLMVDKESGHSNLLKEDEIGVHVVMENNEKIYLETPGFYSRETTKIVGGPLLCHRGKTHSVGPWTCVAKYKWGPMQLKTEKALLKKVQERNVWGVVRSLDFKTVGSTEDLRGGLIFGPPHQLNDITAQSPSWSTPVKLPGNDEAIDEELSPARGMMKLGFQNTIFNSSIITPLALPLTKYSSLCQLLEVFRDSIKAHRSLYQEGGILHRDISTDNIVIPPPSSFPGSPRGMLIDLDVAWALGCVSWSNTSGISHRDSNIFCHWGNCTAHHVPTYLPL